MGRTIRVGDDGTLAAAAALHEQLRGAFGERADISLDLGGLQRADLSLVQLIEAARGKAARDGTGLTLTAPANAVLAGVLDQSGILWAGAPDDLRFWHHQGVE